MLLGAATMLGVFGCSDHVGCVCHRSAQNHQRENKGEEDEKDEKNTFLLTLIFEYY